MRFSLALALFTLSSAVSASSINPLLRRQSFPTCSQSCIANADTMGCDPTDNKCMCSKPAFISAVAACFESACSDPKELEEANAAARALCAAVGITVTAVSSMPETATESATSSIESAIESATESASSVEVSATPVSSPASASGSASAPSSSAAASSSKPTSASASSPAASTSASASAAASGDNGALTHGVSAFALLGAVGAAFIAL